jgi:outer membrane protein OmpA-like peptidoglycan-associated protein
MKTRRLLAIILMAVICITGANAQAWLGKIKDKAVDAGKRAVEQKMEKKAEKADNDEEESASPKKTAKGEAVKSDFVQGTVVIFEDNLKGEQMGEFPSKWDLLDNNAEVAKMNGTTAIRFEHGSSTQITPLVQGDNRKYLPEVYSLEFDYFVPDGDEHRCGYTLHLRTADDDGESETTIGFWDNDIRWDIAKPSGGEVEGDKSLEGNHERNDWNHFALSFNKRALKVYINGQRVINAPNAKAADWFSIETEFWEDHIDYITNIRLAKGGGDLYARNASDMTAVEKAIAETGKFVTNNILFETGKATLKSESMAEIQKVADYMLKNPSVRFEVQGHTDNQGTDKVNDPLSQQRAEAVVKALEGLGVDGFNLRAVGKGSHEPVADNKTEEGRAKNRRVEFIKK